MCSIPHSETSASLFNPLLALSFEEMQSFRHVAWPSRHLSLTPAQPSLALFRKSISFIGLETVPRSSSFRAPEYSQGDSFGLREGEATSSRNCYLPVDKMVVVRRLCLGFGPHFHELFAVGRFHGHGHNAVIEVRTALTWGTSWVKCSCCPTCRQLLVEEK